MNIKIFDALQAIIATITHGQAIYAEVLKLMDQIQDTKENAASKKDWVMAATKHLIINGHGKTWAKWEKFISDFIDSAKAMYNSIKGIVK